MRAKITHPDGGETKFNLDLGVYRCCAVLFYGLLGAYVLSIPAYYFGSLAGPAYLAMALFFVLGVIALVQKHKRNNS